MLMGTLEADGGGSGVAVVSLWGTDGSQRVRLDKEHFIEVMNSLLSLLNAELIKNVKELFLHPACYQRGFAASL